MYKATCPHKILFLDMKYISSSQIALRWSAADGPLVAVPAAHQWQPLEGHQWFDGQPSVSPSTAYHQQRSMGSPPVAK